MRSGETLWRAMQAARAGLLADAGEAPPREGAVEGWSRRRLIQSIAAAGAASALPVPAMATRGPGRVAIIGGGLAGLSALHHLRKAGVDAHVYEARRRVGGRSHTIRPADGTWFERGGQLVNSEHADMHALARVHGIGLLDRKGERHETRIIVDGRAMEHERLIAGLRGIAEQIDRDARRMDADYDAVAAQIDRMSMAAYLDVHARLIPEPWVRRLIEQTARTEYGVEPDRASAIELLFNLPVVDGERFDVLSASDERYVIAGGSASIAEAIAAAHPDRIAMGRDLIRVERASGRLRLTFRDLSQEWADQVILAVPAPITRFIELALPLPPAWHAFAAQMECGRNEKVQAAIPSAPWRPAIGRGGELWHTDAADPLSLGWDGTVAGGAGTPVWNWFFGGHPDAIDAKPDPADLARLADGALPGMAAAARGAIDRTGWSRDPYARGAYVNFPPGQLTRFGHLLWLEDKGGAATQVAGTHQILFAGEHLSDAYPGYMNGAAQTGRLAAAALLGRTIAPDAA